MKILNLTPVVKNLPFGIVCSFKNENNKELLRVQITNIYPHRSGEISGVVKAICNIASRNQIFSYVVSFNKSMSFARFAKGFLQDTGLSAFKTDINIPEYIRQKVYKYLQESQIVDLANIQSKRPSWLFEPFIYTSSPILLYAPKANGKTLLGCFISLMLENFELPYKFKRVCSRVLYLDWESFPNELKSKMDSIIEFYQKKGDAIGDPSYPFYARCIYPLPHIMSQVRKKIIENDIKLIIIDSLVPALGGNINDAHMAGEFFGMIREINSLGAAVLVFTHVAKQNMDSSNDNYTWLGSVMFGNFARMVWAVKSEIIDNELYMTLTCRYNNYASCPKPLDIVFSFAQDGEISHIKVLSKTENFSMMSIPDRITHILKDGAKTLSVITEEVFGEDTPKYKNRIKVTLNRLKKKGIIVNTNDNKWGLKAHD